MKNFPLIGLGIATKGSSGNTLDTFFPCISFKSIEDEFSQYYEIWDSLMSENVAEIKDAASLNIQDEGKTIAISGDWNKIREYRNHFDSSKIHY